LNFSFRTALIVPFNIHISLLQLKFFVLVSLWFPFLFYYNPNLRRNLLHPLMKCKQRFGPKNQTPAGFSPETDYLHARCWNRKAALVWETTGSSGQGAAQASAPLPLASTPEGARGPPLPLPQVRLCPPVPSHRGWHLLPLQLPRPGQGHLRAKPGPAAPPDLHW
ncbi:unnamed protein product, partial [Bubo scandiacus]